METFAHKNSTGISHHHLIAQGMGRGALPLRLPFLPQPCHRSSSFAAPTFAITRLHTGPNCILRNAKLRGPSDTKNSSLRLGATSALSSERDAWVSSVRETTGRHKHRIWGPHLSLDPPPLLSDIVVVLVSPKRPSSVGAVARALSCFECVDLRLVSPRCDHLARSARNGSKGAQYLLWRATVHPTLEDALQGAEASVAFTRWISGLHDIPAYRSMKELLASDTVNPSRFEALPRIGTSEAAQDDVGGGNNISSADSSGNFDSEKLVLVFGREEEGLRVEEVTACTAACSIPIGRLQESLSLSHAVSLVLAPLFEARQKQLVAVQGEEGTTTISSVVERREDLAVGVLSQDD